MHSGKHRSEVGLTEQDEAPRLLSPAPLVRHIPCPQVIGRIGRKDKEACGEAEYERHGRCKRGGAVDSALWTLILIQQEISILRRESIRDMARPPSIVPEGDFHRATRRGPRTRQQPPRPPSVFSARATSATRPSSMRPTSLRR